MKKLALLTTLGLLLSAVALANKTSVSITAPEKVKKGQEVTITLEVKHNGNSKMHHTDWVSLSINGQEVKRWEYNKRSLPPTENFTLEYKLTIDQATTVTALGNCNLHGGKAPITIKISTE
jgi:desulfoferrodoxin (superoxide reductase-like protein)